MTIRVVVKARPHRSVYTPGSTVKCTVSLTCSDTGPVVENMTNYDVAKLDERVGPVDSTAAPAVVIHSATAQLFGVCLSDSTKVDAAAINALHTYGPVDLPQSFSSEPNETRSVLFLTPPTEILSKLALRVHERKTAAVSYRLPQILPPTYRGHAVRYHYTANFVCKWEHKGVVSSTMLRVPIWMAAPLAALSILRPPYVLPDFNFQTKHAPIPQSSIPTLSPPLSDSIFLEDEVAENGISSGNDIVHYSLRQQAEKSSQPVEYCIRYRGQPVVQVLLLSSSLTLGETFRGVFLPLHPEGPDDFVCLRVVVTLESEEWVPQTLIRKGTVFPRPRSPPPPVQDGGVGALPGEPSVVTQCKVVDEGEWFTMHAAQMPFQFNLTPAKYSQTLQTHVVSLRWVARFKFYVAVRREIGVVGASGGAASSGGQHVEKNVLPDPIEWVVPLQLHSTANTANAEASVPHYAI